MTLHSLFKLTSRGRKGYAIIWRATDSTGANTYRVTFNNRDREIALESMAHYTSEDADLVAREWLRAQPMREKPDFKYICNNPRTIEGEDKDCVVRALSIAFNKPYNEVHAICAQSGRRPNKGMRTFEIERAIRLLTGEKDAEVVRSPRGKRSTFTTFAKRNPKGSFIVLKCDHAVALIDGVYHDSSSEPCNLPRSIVTACYRAK